MSDSPSPAPPIVTKNRWHISLVWLVPLVAAVIGLSLIIQSQLSKGPQITISFQTAAGLEPGKTLVKYKDLAVGRVTSVVLSRDHSRVIASVSLDKSAEELARAETRFWVVRPRVGVGGVSGIDTVLSGAYIGVDTGASTKSRKRFAGLETPPTVISGTPGKTFVLLSEDVGSLDIGSPVYYRRIQVGHVAAYQLDDDGQGVSLRVFIDTPYDRFVSDNTRFWNASGIDVSLGANGLSLNTQSLATVVAGGIAFSTPISKGRDTDIPAADQAQFVLAKDRQSALAPPDGRALYIQLRFEQSMRGLAVDAPVEFLGMNLGNVVSVDLDYEPETQHFPVIVRAKLYPQRLAHVWRKLPALDNNTANNTQKTLSKKRLDKVQVALFLQSMVEQGLRAEARTGNLLTGQLYIALDFVADAVAADFDINAQPLVIPTTTGSFDKLQEQLATVLTKVEKIPFDAIGGNLNKNLQQLDKTLQQVNTQFLPETTATVQQLQQTLGTINNVLMQDSPLQQNLGLTLQELQRTSRSLRTLTDMLGRHPEALLRGRPANTAVKFDSAPTTQAEELQR